MPNASTSNAIPRGDIAGTLMLNPGTITPIIPQIFRPFAVPSQTGAFPRIPLRSTMQRYANLERAPRGAYAMDDWEIEQDTYLTREYGKAELVDDREAAFYSSYFDAEVIAARRALNAFNQNVEQRGFDLLFNTTTYPLSGDTGLDTTATWATVATSTPIDDFIVASNGIAARSGLRPNVAVMSTLNWQYLWRSAQVRDQFKYTMVPSPTNPNAMQDMAGQLGVRTIYVADNFFLSSNPGQATTTLSPVTSNSYVWVGRVAETDSIDEPCVGRMMYWTEDGGQFTAESYRDEDRRGTKIRVRGHNQLKELHTALGFLIKVD